MDSPRNNKYELADIVYRFGQQLMAVHKLTPIQEKALKDIALCRTLTLGRNQELCSHCGKIRYTYNSCGNRHCPKCQITKQLQWVEQVSQTTLPVKHYHVIFTVPHELNAICLYNQGLYYSSLFSAVWETLRSFGYSEYGVESGAIAILHSWGQNLTLHPHIHCLVPGAGYSLKGEWKNIGEELFLYPVRQLSATFKGKFVSTIRRKLKKLKKTHDFEKQIQKTYRKPCNW